MALPVMYDFNGTASVWITGSKLTLNINRDVYRMCITPAKPRMRVYYDMLTTTCAAEFDGS